MPAGARGTLIGREQTKQGMKNPANVLFFNTQVPAVLSGKPKRPILSPRILHPCSMTGWVQFTGTMQTARAGSGKPSSTSTGVSCVEPLFCCHGHHGQANRLVKDYGVEPGRVEVLPPGVDLEVWRPAQRENQPFRILFVGGDFERKGGYDLLNAFQELPGSGSGQFELALVTRSPVPDTPGVKVYSHFSPNSPDLIRLISIQPRICSAIPGRSVWHRSR
jgi:glycosyltransferase involved in cell wall biosynthesis